LKDFYGLQVLTRRHHGLPPQPFGWFSNLLDCLGDQLTIRTASKDGAPVAAIMTTRFKNTITYKYGCSNPSLNKLGGMPFLFWKTIEEGKASGATNFDLGRSDLDNHGLIDFKDRLGASQSRIVYYRDAHVQDGQSAVGTLVNYANHIIKKQIVPHLPDRLLMMAGNIMYKHVG
jgi:lipid II:glycine glycyltransferase (peptidoglycan interpeptide bridge formation enzyme)